LKVKTTDELKSCLLKLFLPVAPTMQLLSPGENPKPYKSPEKTDKLLPVVWQHFGVGIKPDSLYKSRRTNRTPAEDFSDAIAPNDYIYAKNSNYKKIKLSARMKAEVWKNIQQDRIQVLD
jgi:hypothetical protein